MIQTGIKIGDKQIIAKRESRMSKKRFKMLYITMVGLHALVQVFSFFDVFKVTQVL